VRSVASTVTQGQELAKALFGIDVGALVQRFGQSAGDGTADDGDPAATAADHDTEPPALER
jgi:hypothetical protein